MPGNTNETLRLASGPLEFTAAASGSGPAVIMLHGFPDTRASFAHQMTALSTAGYRVIAPSMRGYEPGSLAVDDDYGLAAMAQDVLALIEQLGVDKVHLVGHDWGSAIAQLCVATAPDRFHSLTLMSFPQMTRWSLGALRSVRQMRKSWYMLFFQVPFLPEWVIRRENASFIDWLWSSWSPGGSWSAPYLQAVKDAFSHPGVLEAALAYYRQNLNPLNASNLRMRGNNADGIPVRTLGIIGREDGCIDCGVFCDSMREEDFPSGLSLHVVENAGHFPHLEAPDEVSSRLVNFFKESAAAGR